MTETMGMDYNLPVTLFHRTTITYPESSDLATLTWPLPHPEQLHYNSLHGSEGSGKTIFLIQGL